MACLAWSLVRKWCRLRTSHSRVEKNDSAAALSKHDPTRPMLWRMCRPAHKVVKLVAVYVDPRSVWKTTARIRSDPPRTATAILIASIASSALGWSELGAASNLREYRSITVAR